MPPTRRCPASPVPHRARLALPAAALCATLCVALGVGGMAGAAPAAPAEPDPACFSLAPGQSRVLPGGSASVTMIDVRDHICPPPIICLLPNRRVVRLALGEGEGAAVVEINAWHAQVAQRSVAAAGGWLTVEPPAAMCPRGPGRPRRAGQGASAVEPSLPYTRPSTEPVGLHWAAQPPAPGLGR